MQGELPDRKAQHLDLCLHREVEFRDKTTLLEEVELVHEALPELDLNAVDLTTQVLGKRLRAPLVLSGMTGGLQEAVAINRGLAAVAQRQGIALGLGSQRSMLESSLPSSGFKVRSIAPSVLIIGNLGASQAAKASVDEIEVCLEASDVDALAIHLNPAQELTQREGDRDFSGNLAAIERLVETLSKPVVVKETGCGLGPNTLRSLRSARVTWVDVAGAGGTSWVGVETLRRTTRGLDGDEALWDWGIPTAVSTLCAVREGLNTIASGGIRTGLDAARALALGASAVGFALPALKAFHRGGARGVEALVEGMIRQLQSVMLLTGSASIPQLQRAPRVLGPRLHTWMEALYGPGWDPPRQP